MTFSRLKAGLFAVGILLGQLASAGSPSLYRFGRIGIDLDPRNETQVIIKIKNKNKARKETHQECVKDRCSDPSEVIGTYQSENRRWVFVKVLLQRLENAHQSLMSHWSFSEADPEAVEYLTTEVTYPS